MSNEPYSRTYILTIESPVQITMAISPKAGAIRTESPKDSTTDSRPSMAERKVFNVFAHRKQNDSSAKPTQAKPIEKSKPKFGVIRL